MAVVNSIEVSNVKKVFRIQSERNTTLKEKILYANRSKYVEFIALNDVSLNIKRGDSIGLIGSNGSGKSTLLKLISRILSPDRGVIHVHGRVSSLLELGAGFHPDFSGMENIFMNASLLGLTKRDISKKVDEIVEFSGLVDFITQPVRSYSSGMYMRLAFSVATAIDPDILLIDEVLAVGDAEFQTKCFTRLSELRHSGKTIVIVTHDLSSVERFCDRAIWLDKGVMKGDGIPREITQLYTAASFQKSQKAKAFQEDEVPEEIRDESGVQGTSIETPSTALRWGSGAIRITKVLPVYEEGLQIAVSGRGFAVEIHYEFSEQYEKREKLMFGMNICDSFNHSVFGTNTFIDGIEMGDIPRVGHIIFQLDHLQLLQGMYSFDASVYNVDGTAYDHRLNCMEFFVSNAYPEAGVARLDHKWDIPRA